MKNIATPDTTTAAIAVRHSFAAAAIVAAAAAGSSGHSNAPPLLLAKDPFKRLRQDRAPVVPRMACTAMIMPRAVKRFNDWKDKLVRVNDLDMFRNDTELRCTYRRIHRPKRSRNLRTRALRPFRGGPKARIRAGCSDRTCSETHVTCSSERTID